jgi:RimJ/RimL family protein N-acetyltransferase
MIQIPESARLSYRLLTADDSELLFELDQDPEVMRYVNGGEVTTLEKLQEVYLPRLKSYTNPKLGWGMWGAFLKDSNEFLGWTLIRPMDFFTTDYDPNSLEIGWRYHQKHWGNGYATEAAQAVMQALIEQSNISQFTAIAFEENTPSINIMLKLGLTFLKKDRHEDPLGTHELVFYERRLTEST